MLTEFEQWDTRELWNVLAAENDLCDEQEARQITAELKQRGVKPPVKCPVCSLLLEAANGECPSCSFRFDEQTEEEAAGNDAQVCPRCGKSVSREEKNCPRCLCALTPEARLEQTIHNMEAEILKEARSALKGSLMSMVFLGPVIAPLAVRLAFQAVRRSAELRRDCPARRCNPAIDRTAMDAIMIGIVVIILNIAGFAYILVSSAK